MSPRGLQEHCHLLPLPDVGIGKISEIGDVVQIVQAALDVGESNTQSFFVEAEMSPACLRRGDDPPDYMQ